MIGLLRQIPSDTFAIIIYEVSIQQFPGYAKIKGINYPMVCISDSRNRYIHMWVAASKM